MKNILLNADGATGTGWIRANEAVDGKSAQEILKLREQIEQLKIALDELSTNSPPGSENLAQGAQLHTFTVELSFKRDGSSWISNFEYKLSWDQVFYAICPLLDDGCATAKEISDAIIYAHRFNIPIKVREKYEGADTIKVERLAAESLQTIIVQFKALGLIAKSAPRNQTGSTWKLTPLGESKLDSLYAIPSQVSSHNKGTQSKKPKKTSRMKAT